MNAFVRKHGFTSKSPAISGFHIGHHDRISISGKAYDWAGKSGETYFLKPSIGEGLTESFTLAQLSRLSSMGAIRHEVAYYLPDDLKPSAAVRDLDFRISDLTPVEVKRLRTKLAQIRAIEDLVSEGQIQPTTEEIEAFSAEIAVRASTYMAKEASERDLLDHAREQGALPQKAMKGIRKKRGGTETKAVSLYTADYLRKLFKRFQKYGLAALADNLSRSGNRTSAFKPDELVLMMHVIRGSYLTPERKSLKATVLDVKRAFRQENKQRDAEGKPLLRAPGRDAVRGAIRKLGTLRVMIARYGREAAIKKLRPVGQGLEVLRPGQRVEIDEQYIDLMSIMYSAKLHKFFGTGFLEAVGLDDATARWWLTLVIDCRTKIVLGMKLTRNPKASTARECLRMVVSDKGEWAGEAGSDCRWHHAVKPELLVADNGPAFKSELFTNTCLELGISVMRTIAGLPGMRGTVERMFGTVSLDLMPRLIGRTFSNPRERGDYKSEDRACLDAEDFAWVLVRWVVDIYHNTPHAGLDGRTPAEQWDADIDSGNYPVSALPDSEQKRLAFGKQLDRKLSPEGVVVMGIRYHSPEVGHTFIEEGRLLVGVRWDQEDLGAISVYLNGAWKEVPAVHERFAGLNAHVWIKARKALRAKSASRKSWNEDVVFRAIDQIENLVADKSMAFGLIDTSVSDAEFEHIEQELFSNFRLSANSHGAPDDQEPGSVIPPRAPDPDVAPRSPSRPAKVSIGASPPDVAARAAGNKQNAESAPSVPDAAARKPAQKTWAPRKLQEKK